MRDQHRYDSADINGVALNLTDTGKSQANRHHPVDHNASITGENRSMLERSLQLMHDAASVKARNNPEAKLRP